VLWIESLKTNAQVLPVDFGNLMSLTSQSSNLIEKVVFRGSRPPEPVSQILPNYLLDEKNIL
jgi:hypothetical protein